MREDHSRGDMEDPNLFYIYAQAPADLRQALEERGLPSASRFGHHISVYRPYPCIAETDDVRYAIRRAFSEPLLCRVSGVGHVGPDEDMSALMVESSGLERVHYELVARLLISGCTSDSPYFGKGYAPHISVGPRSDVADGALEGLIGKEFSVPALRFACKTTRWQHPEEFLPGS